MQSVLSPSQILNVESKIILAIKAKRDSAFSNKESFINHEAVVEVEDDDNDGDATPIEPPTKKQKTPAMPLHSSSRIADNVDNATKATTKANSEKLMKDLITTKEKTEKLLAKAYEDKSKIISDAQKETEKLKLELKAAKQKIAEAEAKCKGRSKTDEETADLRGLVDKLMLANEKFVVMLIILII
jgi:type IV secretory pathway VirB10-like protein